MVHSHSLVLKIHIPVSGRFCLRYTGDRNPSSSERREWAEGPWQSRSCLSWWRRGQGRELLQLPSNSTHPFWMAGGPWPAAAFSLAGDAAKGISLQRLGYSERTAGGASCGKVCCLPRRRGASGKGILCQGSLLIGTDNEWWKGWRRGHH